MSSEIQSLEISYFLQATEDEDKVQRAVRGLVGSEAHEERQVLEGHHGNTIIWIRYHPKGDEAKKALDEIISHMGDDDRKAVIEGLRSSLDEHNALYIRLSKQVLVMEGTAVLTSSDPIRVKVKPRSFLVKGDPLGFYTRLMERTS